MDIHMNTYLVSALVPWIETFTRLRTLTNLKGCLKYHSLGIPGQNANVSEGCVKQGKTTLCCIIIGYTSGFQGNGMVIRHLKYTLNDVDHENFTCKKSLPKAWLKQLATGI